MPRGELTPHHDEMISLLCTLPEGLSLANCIASLNFHVVLLAAAAAEGAVCWPLEPALGDSQSHVCSSRNKTLDLHFQRHGPLWKDPPNELVYSILRS